MLSEPSPDHHNGELGSDYFNVYHHVYIYIYIYIYMCVCVCMLYVVLNHRSFDCLFNRLCGPTPKNHSSPHYWPFVMGIHRWLMNSPHKGPVTRTNLPFNKVIMSYVSVYMLIRSSWFPIKCFEIVCKLSAVLFRPQRVPFFIIPTMHLNLDRLWYNIPPARLIKDTSARSLLWHIGLNELYKLDIGMETYSNYVSNTV